MSLSWNDNEINPLDNQNCKIRLEEFMLKWQEVIDSFDGKFLDSGYLFVSDEKFSIDISTDSFGMGETPNFDKAVCKFLSNFTEVTGIEAYQMFSFGVSAFPVNFYKELFELLVEGRTNNDNSTPPEYFSLFSVTANVDNVEGQYSGSFRLRKDGTLLAAFDLYEEDGFL